MTNLFDGGVSMKKVGDWYAEAKKLMNGKNSISYQEALSIFQQKNININVARLQQIAGQDKDFNITVSELGSMLYMLDGKKDENGTVSFDNHIEQKTEEGGDLARTLQNTATPEEYENIKKAFEAYGKIEFGLHHEEVEEKPFILNMPAGTRYAVFDLNEAMGTY